MAKYGNLTSWSTFHQNVSSKINNPKISMTDFFDYLLLQGGGIENIHHQIMDEQEKRRVNQALTSKKRYGKLGYLYELNGKPQEGTLFGHIASRLDLSCNIEFNGLNLNNSVNEAHLHEEYEKNAFIRIEGFKGDSRKDIPAANKDNKVFSSEEYLPTKTDVENAYKELAPAGEEVDREDLLNQVKKDNIQRGLTLKSNWRIITDLNIDIWLEE